MSSIEGEKTPVTGDRWMAAVLLGLAAVAAVSHAATLGQPPYWLDEVGTAKSMTDELGFMVKNRAAKGHQPLYFVSGWFWSKLFGFREVGLRSLSLLCVVVAAIFSGLLTRRLIHKRAGVLAALLVLINPIILQYTHFSRPYAMLFMWVVLLMYCTFRLYESETRGKGRIGWAFALGLTSIATLLTHYSGAISVVIVMVWGLLPGKQSRWIVVSTGIALFLWSPWAWWCTQQFKPDELTGGVPGRDNAYLYVLTSMLADLGKSQPLILGMLSLGIFTAITWAAKRLGKQGALLWLIFIAPLVQAVAIYIFKEKSIFSMERYFGALLAAQSILIAAALVYATRDFRFRNVATLATVVILAMTFAWRINRPRYNSSWDEMAEIIQQSNAPDAPAVTLRTPDGFELAFQLDRPSNRLIPDDSTRSRDKRPDRLFKSPFIKPSEIVADNYDDFWLALNGNEMFNLFRKEPKQKLLNQLGDVPNHFHVVEKYQFDSGLLLRFKRFGE